MATANVLVLCEEHLEHPEHRKKGDDLLNQRSWRKRFAALDTLQPPLGLLPARWRQLLDDARWLAVTHSAAAMALGWSASDLFGLHDRHDGWGGLADRLRGARVVKLTEGVAHWKTDDEDGWLWRRTLQPLRLMWEIDP